MKMLAAILSVLSITAVVAAEEATWAIDKRTTSSVLCGVGVTDGVDNKVVAAVGQNNEGNFVNNYDISTDEWTASNNVQTMMMMDSAISRSGKVVAATGFNTFVSTDAKTFTKASVIGVSQAIYSWGSDGESIALVGGFDVPNPDGKAPLQVDGVAYSTDSGASFSVSGDVEGGDARYGAFPTPSTWYVTQGMWAESEQEALVKKLSGDNYRWENKKDPAYISAYHRLNSRLKMHKTGKLELDLSRPVKSMNTTTGWWGAISKTTDGGKTWKQVFLTNPDTDYIYFNQISCFSEDNCMAVAEGQDAEGNDLVAVYATRDGGATWTKTFSPAIMSLMGCVAVNDKEGWISGVTMSGRTMEGQFFKTVDGGKTFDLVQSLSNCYPMDLDFGVEFGAAACISQSGSSSAVAFYK